MQRVNAPSSGKLLTDSLRDCYATPRLSRTPHPNKPDGPDDYKACLGKCGGRGAGPDTARVGNARLAAHRVGAVMRELNLTPLVIGEMFAGVILDLMLVDLFDGYGATGFPVD